MLSILAPLFMLHISVYNVFVFFSVMLIYQQTAAAKTTITTEKNENTNNDRKQRVYLAEIIFTVLISMAEWHTGYQSSQLNTLSVKQMRSPFLLVL